MFLLTASASSGRYADTGPITTVHLILIAVLIALVIAAILWGARQKRARAEGERIEAERTEQMLAHPQTETQVAPVSPPPPPLGDAGVTPTAPASAPAPALAPKPAAKPKAAAKPAKAKAKAKASSAKPAKSKPATKPAAKPTGAKPVVKAKPPAPKPAPAPPAAPRPEPVAAKPAPSAKPVPVPTSEYGLIDVKGLGPKAVPLLNGMGIATLSDLAGLGAARAAEVDAGLGALSGRLTRDRWVEQAKLLATGDVAGFEATYGKL